VAEVLRAVAERVLEDPKVSQRRGILSVQQKPDDGTYANYDRLLNEFIEALHRIPHFRERLASVMDRGRLAVVARARKGRRAPRKSEAISQKRKVAARDVKPDEKKRKVTGKLGKKPRGSRARR
jgi:hypothetical protein